MKEEVKGGLQFQNQKLDLEWYLKCIVKNRGFYKIKSKCLILDKNQLSLVYTPGVGQCCEEIHSNYQKIYEITNKQNTMIVLQYKNNHINDEQLAFTNIQLSLQSLIYKRFANIDSYVFLIQQNYCNFETLISLIENLQYSCQTIQLILDDENLTDKILEYSINHKIDLLIFDRKTLFQKEIIKKIDLIDEIQICIQSIVIKALVENRITQQNYQKIIQDIQKVIQNITFNQNKDLNQNLLDIFQEIQSLMMQKGFLQREDQIQQYKDLYLFQQYENIIQQSKFPDLSNLYKQSVSEKSVNLHKITKGMVQLEPFLKIRNENQFMEFIQLFKKQDLEQIFQKQPQIIRELNFKFCAIISNGTAVLGLGNIGAPSSLPVMEGKSALFSQFGDVSVIPLVIPEKDPEKFIKIVEKISNNFQAICLEDIKAPDCFLIENELQKILDIPIFHDDQHGTSIVVASAVINSLKLANKDPKDVKLVINGAGAAGLSIAEMLNQFKINNIIMCDTQGSIYRDRPFNMNDQKNKIASFTNPFQIKGNLDDILDKADIFIGVSQGNILTKTLIQKMNQKSIIMALANPIPEIQPEVAYQAGAFIVCTGRSDYLNQVNNSLAFPGLFKALIDFKPKKIQNYMKLAAIQAIIDFHQDLNIYNIIPSTLNTNLHLQISKAVGQSILDNNDQTVNRDFIDFQQELELQCLLKQYSKL